MRILALSFLSLVVAVCLSGHVVAQFNKKYLINSWIKQKVEIAQGDDSLVEIKDTLYTRYEIDRTQVMIGFDPIDHRYQFDWEWDNKTRLRIGFVLYEVETLTQDSLVLHQLGARRMSFLSEAAYAKKAPSPEIVDSIDGRPVYKATSYLTPRFRDDLDVYIAEHKHYEGSDHTAAFVASYIITKDGKVRQVKVINSLSPGYDAEVVALISKTVGMWKPAMLVGQPIDCKAFYTIRHLESTHTGKIGG